MAHASAQPVADRPVFLYDGGCGFCTSCARFIERHIPTAADVTPWQSADLRALGVSQGEAEASVQWIDRRPYSAVRASGPAAIARLLTDAGSNWRPLGRLLDMRPIRWVAEPAYRMVARNHRLPGSTAACQLPRQRATAGRH